MGLRSQLRPNTGVVEKNVRITKRFSDNPYIPGRNYNVFTSVRIN